MSPRSFLCHRASRLAVAAAMTAAFGLLGGAGVASASAHCDPDRLAKCLEKCSATDLTCQADCAGIPTEVLP
jgi:uncharacterized membrane protein